MANASPRCIGPARRNAPANLQPDAAPLSVPALRPQNPCLGKHPGAQLSVFAWPLLELRNTDQQALPADRTGLRSAFGIYRLAFRFRLACLSGAGVDLG